MFMISRHNSVITGQMRLRGSVGTDVTVVLQGQCTSCSSFPGWLITQPQDMWWRRRQHDRSEEGLGGWERHPNGMHVKIIDR